MSDELDRLLRDTLETEALSYEPRGDGLTKIRSRIAARRARLRWLVPSLAMAAVAAAVAGVIAVPLVLPDRHPSTPAASHSTAPDPIGAPPSGSPSLPLQAITTLWPYQSRTQAAGREPGDLAAGRLPYLTDARQTALHFISDYLGLADPLEVIRTLPFEAGVGVVLGARNPNNQLYQVTTVYLVRVARGDNAPYVVVRANAPMLAISDVSPGQPGVISVSGTVGGPHEAVQVRLLTLDGHEAATGNDGSVGALTPWRVLLGNTAQPVPPGRYAVLARTLSDATGLLSELQVRPYDQH
ncbi:MAG: hypothetical protein DLM59_04100 [Pseudonocardiales bacterium]|nr:MAG: hypothetical protein DLM59_04100 [Pseudonocardiales bacterium]